MSNLIQADNYGDLLATINEMELIHYEEYGSYQGEYLAVLKDKDRLFYYVGSYGSCSGCDFIESVRVYEDKEYGIPYTEALEFCQQSKPMYIVPENMPLEFVYDHYEVKLKEKGALNA